MNKKIKNIFKLKEYMATIVVSLFIVIVMGFCVELELMFRCEESVNLNELNIENLSKFVTIEELEKQFQTTPDDYALNIKLAKIYDSLGETQKAHEYYKNALEVSKRSSYAIYSYAMFCAKNGLYATAASLVEELDGNSKRINEYKAQIYEEIAEIFDKKGDYSAAIKSYQIVYKYANSLSNGKYLKTIKDKYSKEYIKLADYNIEHNEIKEAISNLENSLRLKKTAIAEYKLGLIYQDSDPVKAEKHINNALHLNPYLINPYIYNSILTKLIDEHRIIGDETRQNHYSSRLGRFKKQISEIYLFKNDVIINNSALLTKKSIFGKIKHVLYFELQNNTKEDLKNLF
ncbi:MAG: tetratricopeptide repeat protein, partial [Candidatus Gastranaerophilales bacterium]|nr:tetratricopeptide repeat protein [Candidatus Gastranaerophilales bacterium]